MRFLRIKQVLDKVGVSRSTLYQKVRDGKFPAPKKLSDQMNVWVEVEVEQWMKDKVAESQPPVAA